MNYNERNYWLVNNGYASYSAYLDSPHWKSFRQRILRERARKCEKCRSTDRIQIHHKTYKRIGREKPKDVLVLCRGCHEKIHHIRPKNKPRKRRFSLCCFFPLILKWTTKTQARLVCVKCGRRDHRMRRKQKLVKAKAQSERDKLLNVMNIPRTEELVYDDQSEFPELEIRTIETRKESGRLVFRG